MVDWFIALTPVLLVPAALVLLYVGCGFDAVGSAPPAPPPAPPPGPTPPPSGGAGGGGGPAPGGGPGGGPPPPPVSVAGTRLQLNLDPNLQGSFPIQVSTLDVTWTLKKAGATVGNLPAMPLHFAPKDPTRTFLEYGVDEWSQHYDANDTELGTADSLACSCVVTLQDGTSSTVVSAAPDAPVVKHSCELYLLASQIVGKSRTFSVTAETASGC